MRNVWWKQNQNKNLCCSLVRGASIVDDDVLLLQTSVSSEREKNAI